MNLACIAARRGEALNLLGPRLQSDAPHEHHWHSRRWQRSRPKTL
jgi:hypothetical protein